MTFPLKGGYDYEFVDPDVPDEFICPICTMVAREAHQSGCCGKMFCKDCLDILGQQRSNPKSCPNCRQSLQNNSFRDINTIRKILHLAIYCNNKKKGCPWKGEVQSTDEHISKCSKQAVRCSKGCSSLVDRCELANHLGNACVKRLVSCVYCKAKNEYQVINGDHFSVCPEVIVPCSNSGCNDKMKRRTVSEHCSICPHKVVSCPNACREVGIKRLEMDEHLKSKCQRRRTTCSYCGKLDEYRIVHGEHIKSTCPNYPIPCPNNCGSTIERQLKVDHKAVCPKERLSCKYKFCGMEMMREDEGSHYRENTDNHLFHGLVELQTGLESLTENVRKFANDYSQKMSNLADALQRIKPQLPQRRTVVRMERFSTAQSKWTSPAFYSEVGGYKMCLVVFPKGIETQSEVEKTTSVEVYRFSAYRVPFTQSKAFHVSVAVNVIPGKHDKELKWPFNETIVVELLNQLDFSSHHKVLLSPAEDLPSLPFTVDPSVKHCALSLNFIEHRCLNSKMLYQQYLLDDVLYFRVSFQPKLQPKPWLAGAI